MRMYYFSSSVGNEAKTRKHREPTNFNPSGEFSHAGNVKAELDAVSDVIPYTGIYTVNKYESNEDGTSSKHRVKSE